MRDCRFSCRTDVDFRPSILLSFDGEAPQAGAEIALFAGADGVDICYDAGRHVLHHLHLRHHRQVQGRGAVPQGHTNYIAPEPMNAPIYALVGRCHGMLCLSGVSFITFLREIFGTILNGVRVIFADDEEYRNAEQLAKLIQREHPAVLGDMTASKLQQFLQSPAFAAQLHTFEACAVGGEAFMPALYGRIRSLSDLDIYNSCGPTETTVHSNTRLIVPGNIMSVGRRLYNVQCDIRDIDGKVLPDGARHREAVADAAGLMPVQLLQLRHGELRRPAEGGQ